MSLAARPRAVHHRGLVDDNARWDRVALRPDDIVISTPPKCGTTWTQMICALLVFKAAELPAPLDRLSPWIDMLTRPIEDVVADLDAQTHRRFLKTHTAAGGLPYDPSVTYIVVGRDPRDVALSWDNHRDNTDLATLLAVRGAVAGLDDLAELFPDGPPVPGATEAERFWQWVDDDTDAAGAVSTLRATELHIESWWRLRDAGADNIVFLHYDDLRADLEGQMRALAARLVIDVPEDRWPELVQAASFESMKAAAPDRVPVAVASESFWVDPSRFFNQGRSGQWTRVIRDDADRARYAARANALAMPAVVEWLHRGPLG